MNTIYCIVKVKVYLEHVCERGVKNKLDAAKEDIVWTSGLNGRKSSTLE